MSSQPGPGRPRLLDERAARDMRNLSAAGYTYRQIGRMFGVSPSAVGHYINPHRRLVARYGKTAVATAK